MKHGTRKTRWGLLAHHSRRAALLDIVAWAELPAPRPKWKSYESKNRITKKEDTYA
jgi:hypothetical protein